MDSATLDCTHPLLAPLTAAQRAAVTHIDGPLLILAGPGSGKTRVITHRVAWMLEQGIAARQIVALTFTNKAAEEMLHRVNRLVPGAAVWMSTFHRFCARLLRQYAPQVGLEPNYAIYDTSDSGKLLELAVRKAGLPTDFYTPDRIASAISWAKNNLLTPADYTPQPGQPLGELVARVYPAYQAELQRANAVDFDDLLLHVACLLRENPEIRQTLDARYRYVLVDEYQDTNLAQYAVVRALSIDYPHLAVTGDPDQSIYGWRGANLNNILEFEHDYPQVRVVRLEQNYRSTQHILRAADTLISHNRRRKPKALFTENEPGRPVRLTSYADQREEAEALAGRIAAEVRSGRRRASDFAIFYRVNALTRSLERALREQGVPYQMIHAVEFYQRKEVKDLVAYLQLLNNPRDTAAFLRIVNTPPRGIGKTTLERIQAHAAEQGISLLEAARQCALIPQIKTRSAIGVAKFVALYDRLSLHATQPVEAILGHVLAETEYRQQFIDSQVPEDQDRLANLEELLSAARQFDEQHSGSGGLEEFLEQSCLVNDTDQFEAGTDCATLMTLHAAKGLEFPVVFIIAVEQGLIPHERSRENDDSLEEERRLLFVGMTRARHELHLSLARQRDFRGQRKYVVPSPFLLELPRDEMEVDLPLTFATGGDRESVDSHDPFAVELAAEAHDHYAQDHVTAPDDSAGSANAVRPAPQSQLPLGDEIVPDNAATAEPSAASLVRGRVPLGLNLTTAAALAGDTVEAAPLSPEMFHQGMVVMHPEHGLGKIIALGGSGKQRRATVAFATAGERSFVLAHAQLRPARASS